MPSPERYRGRFAPSPTGPLHLGSLIAALASYLDARHRGGAWLLRMEDLDPPREQPGAAAQILQGLRAHGLDWDGDIMYQSRRAGAYDEALARLQSMGLLFACDCTRQRLGPGGRCGDRCRPRQADLEQPVALRVWIPPGAAVSFDDRLQGPQAEAFGLSGSDFVVRRKDGYYAYQLAVVVDDADQGISDIVRGSDLLDSTPRQLWLQQQLDYPAPRYLHLPVLNDTAGRKLSKQNRAPALDPTRAPRNLRRCLACLAQPTPPDTLLETADILRFAIRHWSPKALPQSLAITAEEAGA